VSSIGGNAPSHSDQFGKSPLAMQIVSRDLNWHDRSESEDSSTGPMSLFAHHAGIASKTGAIEPGSGYRESLRNSCEK
jgi:hypothetical protein